GSLWLESNGSLASPPNEIALHFNPVVVNASTITLRWHLYEHPINDTEYTFQYSILGAADQVMDEKIDGDTVVISDFTKCAPGVVDAVAGVAIFDAGCVDIVAKYDAAVSGDKLTYVLVVSARKNLASDGKPKRPKKPTKPKPPKEPENPEDPPEEIEESEEPWEESGDIEATVPRNEDVDELALRRLSRRHHHNDDDENDDDNDDDEDDDDDDDDEDDDDDDDDRWKKYAVSSSQKEEKKKSLWEYWGFKSKGDKKKHGEKKHHNKDKKHDGRKHHGGGKKHDGDKKKKPKQPKKPHFPSHPFPAFKHVNILVEKIKLQKE
ncbi:hypothetical protein HK100_009817, partial [Physocladia obscura]